MTMWSNTPRPHAFTPHKVPLMDNWEIVGQRVVCKECYLPEDAHVDPIPPEVENAELGPDVAPRLEGF